MPWSVNECASISEALTALDSMRSINLRRMADCIDVLVSLQRLTSLISRVSITGVPCHGFKGLYLVALQLGIANVNLVAIWKVF